MRALITILSLLLVSLSTPVYAEEVGPVGLFFRRLEERFMVSSYVHPKFLRRIGIWHIILKYFN